MGYSALQYTEMPAPSDPSQDITVSFVMYTKPVLDAFDLDVRPSTRAEGGDASDPLDPNNGTTTCVMRVKNYTQAACAVPGGECGYKPLTLNQGGKAPWGAPVPATNPKTLTPRTPLPQSPRTLEP